MTRLMTQPMSTSSWLLLLVLFLCLSGCSKPSLPSEEVTALAVSDINRRIDQCAEEWINTMALQEDIDKGVRDGIITLNSTTHRYSFIKKDLFTSMWMEASGLPYGSIDIAIHNRGRCPYITPSLEEEVELQAQERAVGDCLDAWTNQQSLTIIQSGVALEVIHTDPNTGLHHVDPNAEKFSVWLWDNFSIPWETIRIAVIYGEGCPY